MSVTKAREALLQVFGGTVPWCNVTWKIGPSWNVDPTSPSSWCCCCAFYRPLFSPQPHLTASISLSPFLNLSLSSTRPTNFRRQFYAFQLLLSFFIHPFLFRLLFLSLSFSAPHHPSSHMDDFFSSRGGLQSSKRTVMQFLRKEEKKTR